MLYTLKHGLHYYTYLNTVWAQFWRPNLTLGQKYRRLDGPRVHSRLLSTNPSLHIRTVRKESRFHCHSTRRPTGPPELRHAPPQHGSVVSRLSSMCAIINLTARGETAEDWNSGARGRRDLHARERESRSLNSSRCAARSVASTAERAVRDDARDSPPPTDEARRDEARYTTTRALAHTRADRLAARRLPPLPHTTAPPAAAAPCRQPNHADTPRRARLLTTSPPDTRSADILKSHTKFDFKISLACQSKPGPRSGIFTKTSSVDVVERISCAVNGHVCGDIDSACAMHTARGSCILLHFRSVYFIPWLVTVHFSKFKISFLKHLCFNGKETIKVKTSAFFKVLSAYLLWL